MRTAKVKIRKEREKTSKRNGGGSDDDDESHFRRKRHHKKLSKKGYSDSGENSDEDSQTSDSGDKACNHGRKRRKVDRKSSKVKELSDSEDNSALDSGTPSQDERRQEKHRRERKKDYKKEKDHKKKRREREKKGKKDRRGSREKRRKIHSSSHHSRHNSALSPSGSDLESSETDFASPAEVATSILKKFPEVANDLRTLLEMIDDGQAVDISGLTNKHLAASLKELFQSLHLPQTGNGMFLLPEGASRKTMDVVGPTLSFYSVNSANESMENVAPSGNDLQEGIPEPNNSKEGSSGPAEKVGGAETLGNPDSYGLSEPRRRVIGPAMPSAEMLAAAARLTEAGSALREAEEELELDPLIGPPPPAAVAEAESANEAERFEEVARILAPDVGNAYELLGLRPGATAEIIKKRYWKLSLLVHPDKCAHPQAHQAFTALNQAFKDLQDPTKRAAIDRKIEEKQARDEYEAELKAKHEAAQWRRLRGESLPGDDELLNETPKAPTRDEWMTVIPPERQAGPPSMHSTFFSKSEKTGRGDTSVWTDTPLEKAEKAKMQYLEAYKQAALTAAKDDDTSIRRERTSQAAEMMDKFNDAKRTTSLVEKHQLQRSKKPKKENTSRKEGKDEWSGKHPWKPWDREKDLASGGQSLKLDGGSMAQGLSSRFSSSNVERSFL